MQKALADLPAEEGPQLHPLYFLGHDDDDEDYCALVVIESPRAGPRSYLPEPVRAKMHSKLVRVVGPEWGTGLLVEGSREHVIAWWKAKRESD